MKVKNKANELFLDDIINLIGNGVKAFPQRLQVWADLFLPYHVIELGLAAGVSPEEIATSLHLCICQNKVVLSQVM